MLYRISLLMLLFSTLGMNNDSVPSRVLVSSSSHLLEVPSFGFYGHAQCDKDSNLFFHSDTTPFNHGTVLKLKSGSWEPTLFEIQQNASEKMIFEAFSVTPSGQVWQIGETTKSQFLFAFTSDGEMTSRTKLEMAENVFVQDFAVSDRGTTLVAGYFDSTADAELQGKPYIALFDHSGHLLKRFTEPFEQIDVASEGGKIHAGHAVFADDGSFYILHEQTILVLSESGSLIHRIKFDKPDKAASPTNIAISGGMAAIWLTYVDKKKKITQQFLVLDLQIQEPLALYTPAPELSDSGAMCFSRKDGFEFYGSNQAGSE
jgi:hypothetical protein